MLIYDYILENQHEKILLRKFNIKKTIKLIEKKKKNWKEYHFILLKKISSKRKQKDKNDLNCSSMQFKAIKGLR